MKNKFELSNGNLVQITSKRIAYGNTLFTYTIADKNGKWIQEHTGTYPVGYYNSIEEYIKSHQSIN
jgi:hypothetical protein